MTGSIDLKPEKKPWWHFPAKAAAIIIGVFLFVQALALVQDRRPPPPLAYDLMSKWTNNPIQYSGADYSPLLPMIREVMDDEIVYLGEWKRVQKAQEAIDREHHRQRMIRTLRSNRISG